MATTKRQRRTKRRVSRSASKPDRYLRSLRADGFRGFKKLEIDGLAQVCIITGDNGSGKSTLLEAAFALYGRTSPAWMLNVQGRRGLQAISKYGLSYLGLFFRGAEDGSAVVSGVASDGTRLRLEIQRAGAERHSMVFETDSGDSIEGVAGIASADIRTLTESTVPLQFRAFRNQKEECTSELRWVFRPPDQGEFRIVGGREGRPKALLQHPSDGALGLDDKARFGDIREAGRDRAVLDLVRRIDPRVEDIEYLQTSRTQYFRARLKDGSTLPLGMLGGGVVNTFRSGVNLAFVADGFLAIDEIENGLHFSRHAEVFSSLLDARRQFGAQLMLATHSGEALGAMVHAAYKFDPDSFAVVHLRRESHDSVLANVIAGKDALSSIEHGYDLR